MRAALSVAALAAALVIANARPVLAASPGCEQPSTPVAGEQTGVDNGALPRNVAGSQSGTEPSGKAASVDWRTFDKNDHTRAATPEDYQANAGSRQSQQVAQGDAGSPACR
jgi:hypothetical protein